MSKHNEQASPEIALCGTEFCWKEVELSVAYLVRDLEKQKELEALSFCNPPFSFYTVSAVLQRGEAGQTHFQEKGESLS